MNIIHAKNIISPKVIRICRLILGIILLVNIIKRIVYPWNSEIPALLYFTILTNLSIATYYIVTSIIRKPPNKFIIHALTTYILIVALVFVFFLSDGFVSKIYAKLSEHVINPTVHYVSMTNSMITHYVMPIVVTLDYLILTDMRKINIDFRILIFPIIYLIMAMAYGMSTGCFVYPFLDSEYLGGWIVLGVVIIALIGVFVLASFSLKTMNCKIQNTIENYYRKLFENHK